MKITRFLLFGKVAQIEVDGAKMLVIKDFGQKVKSHKEQIEGMQSILDDATVNELENLVLQALNALAARCLQ